MLTLTHWDVLLLDDWGMLEDWLDESSLSPEVCQKLCVQAARYDAGDCLLLLIRAKVVDQDILQRALLAAINNRSFTTMHLLLRRCDCNYYYRQGTPLHCALWYELTYGLQLEDITGKGLRHITQSIELILEYNPDPTLTHDGLTPRELAITLNQVAAAELLAAYEQRYATTSHVNDRTP